MTNTIVEKTQQLPLPEYVRAPSRGQEYFSGVGRSKLYQLANEGKIRSISLREGAQKKGTRLFHLRSVLDYIERNAQQTSEVIGNWKEAANDAA
jgi:hypothetical protein